MQLQHFFSFYLVAREVEEMAAEEDGYPKEQKTVW